MIYVTSQKKIKKLLKSFKKVKKVVINSPNEREIFRRLEAEPDTHIILIMDNQDSSAIATVLSQYSGIDSGDLEKIIFDANDKKRLAKDLSKHSDELFKKIDEKIEKARDKCESTYELSEKRGNLYAASEGDSSKEDTLKIHAKYRKIPKSLLKKIKKVKTFGEVGELK